MNRWNGQPAFRLSVFVCVFLFFGASVPNVNANETSALEDLSRLARSGAPQLALRRMDQEQPPADKSLVGWMIWEQERLQILHNQGKYPELIQRVEKMPDSVDPYFRYFALTLKVEAQLQLGKPSDARSSLRELLWFSSDDVENQQLVNWRRLIVRSYVLEDLNEDARLALLKYRQDFGGEDPLWRWLNAQVMLQSGHAASVEKLLQDDQSLQGQFLREVARLAVSPQQADSIAENAVQHVSETEQPELKAAYWGLAANAAKLSGRQMDEIHYLEQALSLPQNAQWSRVLGNLNSDRLWQAWLAYGQEIGNQEQLLIGDDASWFFPATEAIEKNPLKARVLFVVLAEYSADPKRRGVANEYLLELLDDLPQSERLIRVLFLDSSRYQDADRLPDIVRYRLIDDALDSGDLHTASRLMKNLEVAPAGSDDFEWNLRRARVSIYTGNIDTGVAILKQLLASEQEWNDQRVGHFLQVVFDLQTIQHHPQALEIFTALMEQSLPVQQHREILFWMADSSQVLKQYDQAAYLYLKSATLADPLAMDPWAQTARYRAAKTLVEAGLLDDAKQIYSSLLRATQDSSRKAALQNDIQRLRLLRSAQARSSTP